MATRVRFVFRVRGVLMAKQDQNGSDSVPVKVIAAENSVTVRTVRRWIAARKLRAFQALKGGRIRVKRSDYLRFLRNSTKGEDGDDSSE
jgi:excisionase family DNA binding protein